MCVENLRGDFYAVLYAMCKRNVTGLSGYENRAVVSRVAACFCLYWNSLTNVGRMNILLKKAVFTGNGNSYVT